MGIYPQPFPLTFVVIPDHPDDTHSDTHSSHAHWTKTLHAEASGYPLPPTLRQNVPSLLQALLLAVLLVNGGRSLWSVVSAGTAVA